jgi:hypothetical protein
MLRDEDQVTEQDSTGLAFLTDDELRTHVRIMLEGTGHRGPQAWPMDNLDDDIYQEIERRVPAISALRTRQDELLDADMARRRESNPTTPEVSDYSDVYQEWADPQAEQTYVAARDEWRALMTGWLEGH